jgi:tetratricopeptide (TPR) repeat protein
MTSEKVLVIATYRNEKLFVEAEGKQHPLLDTLRLMRREDLVRELEITNLSQEEVLELAKNMLGGDLQPEFADKLVKKSQGNPLFVVESVRMLHEREGLVLEASHWRLTEDKLEIPAKIKDLILQRLSVLTRNQRRLLDLASVIGERFGVEILASVLGLDCLEVTETLDEIRRATSLVCCAKELYMFDHARSRDAIYEEMSPTLRMSYHAKVAEKLEGGIKNIEPMVSAIAYHYTEAGNKEKSVEYVLAAAKDELKKWSNFQAIKHFEYVLQNIPEGNVEQKRTALEGLGDAYYENNMFKQATKTFEDLSNSETGPAKLRALRKAMDSTFQYTDIAHLMELVKKAEPYAAADRLENARVLIQRGRVHLMQRMRKLACEDWEAALHVFEEVYSLWDAAAALLALGVTHAVPGEAQKGIAESLRAFALYEDLQDFRVQMAAGYHAGQTFFSCELRDEALCMFAKVMEIGEKTKIGASIRLFFAYALSSRVYESLGDWEEALSHSLKALELSKKIDNSVAPAIVYSNLTRIYVRLGDLRRAEEYFEKLMEQPQEVLLHYWVPAGVTKAVFFAGKGQWKESNQCFKEYFEELKVLPFPDYVSLAKPWFAWALENQGRSEEASVMLEDVQRALREVDERFAHVCLQASLMVRREVRVGEEFEMHLDFVNVSRKPGFLVKAETVIPLDGFKVISLPSWCSLQNCCIEMKNKEIGAFQVVIAKLTLQAVKAGIFTLNPKVFYLDELGETKTSRLQPLKIQVEHGSSIIDQERATSTTSDRFEFKSEVTQKAFDYLVRAFVEDYMRRRIAQEKAGWRSLMRIVEEAKLPRSSMYDSRGGKGRALIELESRGLVEARFYPGERGRGGKILKLRVAYEKEIIKHTVDNRIMHRKKE